MVHSVNLFIAYTRGVKESVGRVVKTDVLNNSLRPLLKNARDDKVENDTQHREGEGENPFPVCTLLPAQRQGHTPGAGVSVGATCLIPTGNGLRPSFAQPVGEVVPALLATALLVDAAPLLVGIFRDAHVPICARWPR